MSRHAPPLSYSEARDVLVTNMLRSFGARHSRMLSHHMRVLAKHNIRLIRELDRRERDLHVKAR